MVLEIGGLVEKERRQKGGKRRVKKGTEGGKEKEKKGGRSLRLLQFATHTRPAAKCLYCLAMANPRIVNLLSLL